MDYPENYTPESEENVVNTFEKRFGWFAVINRISGDDITKHNSILDTTILGALNQLLYLMEKDKEIIRLQKEQMKRH